MAKCYTCKGKGVILVKGICFICWKCHGSGKIEKAIEIIIKKHIKLIKE